MPSYAYTQNIQVYDGVPFSFVMRKAGYYDIRQTKVGTIGMFGADFQSYSGLTLASEQITGSLMTVSISGGTLPDETDTGNVLGCLATAGQSYEVETSGGTATAIGLLPSGVVDDGTAKTWNLFYDSGVFLLDTVATKQGYSWCGTINIPAHTV